MIFPFLLGLRSPRLAPVTWLLFALNAAVLIWAWGSSSHLSDQLDTMMDQDFFVETQGRIYENYLREHSAPAPEVVRELASLGDGNPKHFELMGHLAFRDELFLDNAPTENLLTDVVAQSYWRDQLEQIKTLQESHPSFLLGVSTDTTNMSQWFTYIFSHSNWSHFFGNMVFLIIFGAALEEMIGGLALLVVFLLTGAFAAGFFLWLSGPTTAPLIGASGAISGVMTMYCVLQWRRPSRLVYWLFLPTREAMGFVYFPTWTIFVLWLMTDLAGYLGNLDVMGGVAHAAHLGGDCAGFLIGLMVLGMWRLRHHAVPVTQAPAPWRLYPFLNMSFRKTRA